MKHELIKNNKNIFLEGPILITPDKFFDERGFFLETWKEPLFNKLIGSNISFVQENHSKSKKNVLRGLHYQIPPSDQGKLVRCISGKIFDVIVDIRKSSKNFLSWAGIFLDDKTHKQVWIPSGFAHGFYTLSENAEITYKMTSLWSKEDERSIKWNDPNLLIEWPLKRNFPILSKKDNEAITLDKILDNDLFI